MNDELVRNIYERMGSMEAKIDDIRQIRDTSDMAQRTAEKALQAAETNEKAIERNAASMRWSIGTILVVLVPVVMFVISRVFA